MKLKIFYPFGYKSPPSRRVLDVDIPDEPVQIHWEHTQHVVTVRKPNGEVMAAFHGISFFTTDSITINETVEEL